MIRIHGLKDRDTLRSRLLEKGIQTGVHYQPNHKLTLFRDSDMPPLSVTDMISSELLSLPLHPDVSKHDVSYICDQLISSLD